MAKPRERNAACTETPVKNVYPYGRHTGCHLRDSTTFNLKIGFLTPWLAIEPRCHPIPGLGHIARDPRIARLVRPDKSEGSQMAEMPT